MSNQENKQGMLLNSLPKISNTSSSDSFDHSPPSNEEHLQQKLLSEEQILSVSKSEWEEAEETKI